MPVLPLYRNQSTNLQSKSMDWFLYEGQRKSIDWFLYEGNNGIKWVKIVLIYFSEEPSIRTAQYNYITYSCLLLLLILVLLLLLMILLYFYYPCIIFIVITELTHNKTIRENTVEIEPQPVALDFKNLSQYCSRSK